MNPFNLTNQYSLMPAESRFSSFRVVMRLGAAFLVLTALHTPSFAQSRGETNNALVQEIERLRRDLSDVQRFVYRGGDTAAPPAAANAGPAGAQSARLQRQLLEMQGQMRELTGHIERLQHDIRTMGARLDKLVADVDIRLQALEGGARVQSVDRGAGTLLHPNLAQRHPTSAQRHPNIPQTSPPSGTTVISSDGVTGTGAGLAPGQKSLGEISRNDLAAVRSGQIIPPSDTPPPGNFVRPIPPVKRTLAQAAPAPGSVTSSVATVSKPLSTSELPEGTARQQYEYAFGKLKERNYDDAEIAFRAFAERHPDDPLAGNAMYWMGETYYVRKQYSEAARIFLDAFQRFPKGNKAPDNLFKLAKSLVQIGETQSACTTYAELVKTFPQANRRIIGGARADMTRLGCG